MDAELAAHHEAGHAVMQWFVGWELKCIQMTLDGSNATAAAAECPCPGFKSKSDIRKRLLVLFAGNTATLDGWPESNNNKQDWLDAVRAVNCHLQREPPIKWYLEDGMTLRDLEADGLVQTARLHTRQIVSTPEFGRAVRQVATTFMSVLPESDGRIRLAGADVTAICEQVVGNTYRTNNPWANWIAGN